MLILVKIFPDTQLKIVLLFAKPKEELNCKQTDALKLVFAF